MDTYRFIIEIRPRDETQAARVLQSLNDLLGEGGRIEMQLPNMGHTAVGPEISGLVMPPKRRRKPRAVRSPKSEV